MGDVLLDVRFHAFSPRGGIVRSAPPGRFPDGLFTGGVDLLLEPGECLRGEVRR